MASVIMKKYCPICQKAFYTKIPRRKTCSDECAKEYNLMQEERRSLKYVVKHGKRKISDVNAEARKQGLTYGQYVASLYEKRRIERRDKK